MPTSRYRTQDLRVSSSGSYYRNISGTVFRTKLDGEFGSCLDTIGNFPNDNALEIISQYVERPVLNGEQISGGAVIRRLIDYPVDWTPNPVDPYALGVSRPNAAELNNYAWELLAKTNISQPHVSVPTFIAELKDIPLLVRDWGGNLLRRIAKGHLTWRWAIKPMIGDLRKLIGFWDAVHKRTLNLSLMNVQRTARRTAGLGSSDTTNPLPPSAVMHSTTGFVVNAKRGFRVRQRIWGSVQWKLHPSVSFPLQGFGNRDDELMLENLALRLTFGITSYEALATLWEITPWSWFVDWFAGIGTMVSALNNSVPATWSRTCIMCHSESNAEWSSVTGVAPWATLSGNPVERYERKERYVVGGPFAPYIPSFRPLVDPKAWSILASLYALKKFKG